MRRIAPPRQHEHIASFVPEEQANGRSPGRKAQADSKISDIQALKM